MPSARHALPLLFCSSLFMAAATAATFQSLYSFGIAPDGDSLAAVARSTERCRCRDPLPDVSFAGAPSAMAAPAEGTMISMRSPEVGHVG